MKRNLSSIILLLTAVFWGAGFVGQTLGSKYNGAFIFNGTRFLIGALFLIPIVLLAERDHPNKEKKKRTTMAALLGGTVLFISAALQQFGAGLTYNPGKSGFLTGLYTVITPICYFLFFRRKSGLNLWIGAALAVGGLFLLCYDGTAGFQIGRGELLLIGCSFCWTAHIMVVDRFVVGVSPLKFACGQFFVCGILNLIFSFLFETPTLASLAEGRGPILFCGIVSVGLGFTGQIVGQKLSDDPTRATILLSTEALFSALIALLWNALPIPQSLRVDASMNIYGVLGCILIFAAIILAQIPAKSKEGKSTIYLDE